MKMPDGKPCRKVIEKSYKEDVEKPYVELCVNNLDRLPALKIAVSGVNGIGKSTALRKVLERIPQEPLGFVTQPIREGDTLKGFNIVDLFDGSSYPIAYFDSTFSVHPVVEGFESVGVSALAHALQNGNVVLMDELGFLERDATNFKNMVLKVLKSDKLVFCVIKAELNDFLEEVVNRVDRVFTIDRENRDEIPDSIWRFICSTKTL